jgi:cation transport ATPase
MQRVLPEKFLSDAHLAIGAASSCGGKLESPQASAVTSKYFCPMCPSVASEEPSDCSKCGMALEPKTATASAEDEENAELRDMTMRFRIGAALTLPVFVLAMAHMIPTLGAQSWVNGHASRWLQFALTTPVVCWAGWPFFQRGWRSLVTRHLNMFTLIAIGVGATYRSSASQMQLKFLLQGATSLYVQCLIDCFVRHATKFLVWVLSLQPTRNLLWGPLPLEFSGNNAGKLAVTRKLTSFWS